MDGAETEYINCIFGAKENVANIQCIMARREDKARAEAVASLRKMKPDVTFCAWREYPPLEQWWKAQEQVLLRQDVCVVVGPTKTGKTQMAMARCGAKALVVNCHGILDPDLRRFKGWPRHTALILDEGGPKMLAKHRDLLQATNRDITLGHSGTNMYTYTVNLFRVKVLITSNEWYDELKALSKSDRDWVKGNTVMIDVDEPCWIEEQGEEEPSFPQFVHSDEPLAVP